jgi:hypothetical protein
MWMGARHFSDTAFLSTTIHSEERREAAGSEWPSLNIAVDSFALANYGTLIGNRGVTTAFVRHVFQHEVISLTVGMHI